MFTLSFSLVAPCLSTIDYSAVNYLIFFYFRLFLQEQPTILWLEHSRYRWVEKVIVYIWKPSQTTTCHCPFFFKHIFCLNSSGFDFFPWQLESFNYSFTAQGIESGGGRSLSPGGSSIVSSQGSSGLVPDYDIGPRDITEAISNLSLKDVQFGNKKWTKIRQIGAGAFGTVSYSWGSNWC